ncbi:hypothetical protein [Deinococcus sp.]|uniref:hypothetical protein n=1 Tax=Deinococcus sp. TaxID=47478 RepID=UPI003CC69D7A
MANYAEKVAYWYFRLNGFFPLANYVLHAKNGRGSADTDLIAIRMPFATEKVGSSDAIDNNEFSDQGIVISKTCAIICEVKSGRKVSLSDIKSIKNTERLKDAVGRIGFVDQGCIDEIVGNIIEFGSWQDEGEKFYICTRLVCSDRTILTGLDGIVKISLDSMQNFISKRMSQNFKETDWYHFGDDYIQMVIKSNGRNTD